MTLVPHLSTQLAPIRPISWRSFWLALQYTSLADCRHSQRMGFGDGFQLDIENPGKCQQVIALISQCNAYWADPFGVKVLAIRQLGGHEIKPKRAANPS